MRGEAAVSRSWAEQPEEHEGKLSAAGDDAGGAKRTSAEAEAAAEAEAVAAAEAAAEAAGPLFEPGLVLYRDHTVPAPQGHVAATTGDASTAKAWDTVKPLGRWFSRLHRVVLVDDDAYKACPGEQPNMVRVPCWDDSERGCEVLQRLVEGVQQLLGPLADDGDADVRGVTAELSARMLSGGGGGGDVGGGGAGGGGGGQEGGLVAQMVVERDPAELDVDDGEDQQQQQQQQQQEPEKALGSG